MAVGGWASWKIGRQEPKKLGQPRTPRSERELGRKGQDERRERREREPLQPRLSPWSRSKAEISERFGCFGL